MNKLIIGIDEVGRGCWAGPLVVGAVVLSKDIPGLTDSKLLTKTSRQAYSDVVQTVAEFCATGWVWPEEIDQLGLTAATRVAIKRALKTAPKEYPIIIDGSFNYLAQNTRAKAIVKADLTIPSVSAASVVAKVARDAYMAQQAELWPGYGFEQHVGYGTAQHKAALAELGVCPIHRQSYKPIQNLKV